MTLIEIILKQMAACYNETNWLVTTQTALKDVTSEQASWHGLGLKHNILELVNHLIFWNEHYLNRFKGTTQTKIEVGNEHTFGANKPVMTEDEWQALMLKLDTILSELYDEVKNADENKLQSSASGGKDDSWYSVLANVNIHNAYHIGQIVSLRKEQGSWNPETGVN